MMTDSTASDDWEDCEEEEEIYYKMVFVVNMELNMGVGKVASQVNIYVCFFGDGMLRAIRADSSLIMHTWQYALDFFY